MRKVYIFFMLLFLFASSAMAGDIFGNWHLEMQGAEGLEKVDFTVKVAGENLSITGEHSGQGKFEGGKGTLKGDVINMTFPITIKGTVVDFIFAGTLKGDTMEGTKKYMGHTPEKIKRGPTKMNLPEGWTAIRKK